MIPLLHINFFYHNIIQKEGGNARKQDFCYYLCKCYYFYIDKKELLQLVNEIVLNETTINVYKYEEEIEGHLHKLSVEFNVTSEDYHDITTLLYKGTFDVKVPERDLSFRASIQQYSTSFTNLYIKGQVGEFKLSLLEVQE
jgi:hypothetical protein